MHVKDQKDSITMWSSRAAVSCCCRHAPCGSCMNSSTESLNMCCADPVAPAVACRPAAAAVLHVLLRPHGFLAHAAAWRCSRRPEWARARHAGMHASCCTCTARLHGSPASSAVERELATGSALICKHIAFRSSKRGCVLQSEDDDIDLGCPPLFQFASEKDACMLEEAANDVVDRAHSSRSACMLPFCPHDEGCAACLTPPAYMHQTLFLMAKL